ncbi:hypothetical protein IW261DRAFT_1420306 [Armillaria novae-zelandiae]|uniref:Uncharacterized protein n=1 Tax=Armillaria novae-zelandiae TaxID=153914 RepID=A0AA39TBX9_9AGAR|nr:hypothetical protein IW261DRAFT_1420306 [Armillaria novae-zelandiae]
MEMRWESLRVWTGSINWRLLGVSRGVIIKVLMTRHPDSPALELASVSHTKEVIAVIVSYGQGPGTPRLKPASVYTTNKMFTAHREQDKTFIVQCVQCDVGRWDAERRAQVVWLQIIAPGCEVIVEWTHQVWLPRVVDKYSYHASVVARLWLGWWYGLKEYVE